MNGTLKPQREAAAFTRGSYIKEIQEERGGGGELMQIIHLDGGKVIVLAYGMIGVYNNIHDFWAEDQKLVAGVFLW